MDPGEEVEEAALEHRRRGRERCVCALVCHRRGIVAPRKRDRHLRKRPDGRRQAWHDGPASEIGPGRGSRGTGDPGRRERSGNLAEQVERAVLRPSAARTASSAASNLCALGLDEPCPTFRPDTPEGLVPPRQPALLMRDAAAAPRAAGRQRRRVACNAAVAPRLESPRGHAMRLASLESHSARQVALVAGRRRRLQRLPGPGRARPTSCSTAATASSGSCASRSTTSTSTRC